jgi:hypothetical protein
MVSKGQIAEILIEDGVFMDLKAAFDNLRYLENLSFEVLARHYHQALLRDNE